MLTFDYPTKDRASSVLVDCSTPIVTDVQIVGDCCESILSYPPFSLAESTPRIDEKIGSGGASTMSSLSFFSESFGSESSPFVVDQPSPCIKGESLLQSCPTSAQSEHFQSPTPYLSPSKDNTGADTTPELFTEVNSYQATPELLPCVTPIPRNRHLPRSLDLPNDPMFTPDIL